MTKWLPCLVLLTLAASLTIAPASLAKEMGATGAAQGVVAPPAERGGPSYRYVTVNPQTKPALTIVERIDMNDGAVDRWWYLRGSYVIPAVAYDGSAGGLSANGNVLALIRLTRTYPPPRTKLAILDTDVYLRHPRRPGQRRPPHAIRYFNLPGYFGFQAISPSGSKLYLRHYRSSASADFGGSDDFGLRVLDARSGKLARRPLTVSNDDRPLAGLPVSGDTSTAGRWTYSLYDGDMRRPFLLALDTVSGRLIRVDLPGLESQANPYLLKLRLDEDGRHLAVFRRSPQTGRVPDHARSLLSVDVARLTRERQPAIAEASDFLSFAQTPRRPGNLLERDGVVGHSSAGRPIHLRQLGDPAIAGKVLVFGCIHGDECAARGLQPLTNGCPDPHADLFIVPNLNPDGLATGTRLNGRGVDLNRNFPAEWKPIGALGDPQYSGPRPLSEPEARLAARIVERLQPQVTIWFHQHRGGRALVRAWGGSAAGGRLFAQLAQLPFRRIAWPNGTAPNWQNHRFPGTNSYVVELPPGPLSARLGSRLEQAIVRIGRWEAVVGED